MKAISPSAIKGHAATLVLNTLRLTQLIHFHYKACKCGVGSTLGTSTDQQERTIDI